jgi:3'(2'), 5'-bisphosphate nucleotidase
VTLAGLAELAELAPGIPVVAEERAAAGKITEVGNGPFFLVDPLNGTKQFVERNGQFTVNIALIERQFPTLGVVHLPELEEAFWMDGRRGAFRRTESGEAETIRCHVPTSDRLVVSRSHRN